LLAELVVGPLTAPDVGRLLAAHGVQGDDAERIRAFARGHPLALVVAAEALARRPGLPLGSGAPAEVVEELFAVILDDLPPEERDTVEAAAVLRRVTMPLLAAVVDGQDSDSAWRTLRQMPFMATTGSGLELDGLAAPVLLEALELRDPLRVRGLRVRAARSILDSLDFGPDWQSTADLLHLVQNPLIRNAYAPPGMLQHPVEQARPDDHDEILDIARRFTGPESAGLTELWWQTRREAFCVVRGTAGEVAGFSVTALLDDANDGLTEDPAIAAVTSHLRREPMPPDSQAIIFRWALGSRYGEKPTPETATLVVDLKRTYLELRSTLRRVYSVIVDWPATAPVLHVMGFRPLEEVHVGQQRFVLACLDFGPGGVSAWIGRHVLAEHLPAPSAPVDGDPADGLLVMRLTPREREVLGLLAAGMTNAELARTLFISERTANRHISNIFTKLGVHNRTQAARAAVAAGLVD
jgi:DNA-binding CsgD family transcriptional regulator